MEKSKKEESSFLTEQFKNSTIDQVEKINSILLGEYDDSTVLENQSINFGTDISNKIGNLKLANNMESLVHSNHDLKNDEHYINDLLNEAQIDKNKLDEYQATSSYFNNNLKLYLVINLLGNLNFLIIFYKKIFRYLKLLFVPPYELAYQPKNVLRSSSRNKLKGDNNNEDSRYSNADYLYYLRKSFC